AVATAPPLARRKTRCATKPATARAAMIVARSVVLGHHGPNVRALGGTATAVFIRAIAAKTSVHALTGRRTEALSAADPEASGRTSSTMAALNFSGSSTKASCPD